MHELPKGLNNSLRSWRGSTHGNRSSGSERRDGVVDLEKGLHGEDYDDKEFERALNPTMSSLILHPAASAQAMHQAYIAQQQSQPFSRDFHADPRRTVNHPPPLQTTSLAKRQPTLQSPGTANSTGIHSIFSGVPKVADSDPAADRLDDDTHPLSPNDFYELMGMNPPISKKENPPVLATRHGLYGRIHHDMEYTQTKYRTYDVLIYVFLILQLFLSAVFIILGSLNRVDTHIAIAVLGGFSTVIAGALALMKGQGLPNRLRQTRDALRNVVFEAEELYWDVGADRKVFFQDVKKVREDYLRVLEEARKNHPDTWNATTLGIGQGIRRGGAGAVSRVGGAGTTTTTTATTAQGYNVAAGATPAPVNANVSAAAANGHPAASSAPTTQKT